jgi:endonuclease/exonuclease/phosphatase family metal-dependent hydrolase
MRVATFNLWDRSGAWPDRRRLLIEGFRDLAPDVVLLQEAEDRDHVADLLGPDYHGDEPGHTYTPVNPLVMEESEVTREEPRRIDDLFVRAGSLGPCLDVVDCRLIFEEAVASDHFGLVAGLERFGEDAGHAT